MRTEREINETLLARLKLAHAMRLTLNSATRSNAIVLRREFSEIVRQSTWNPEMMQSRKTTIRLMPGCCVDSDTAETICSLGCWIVTVHELCAYWVAKPYVLWDDENRRHCDTGHAVMSDVGNWYFVHGVEVPGMVVTKPELITQRHIDQERNLEVRRVMIERWTGGWERYLNACGEVIDSRRNDRDAQTERLYDSRDGRRLIVSDPSTGRRYALGVPTRINTCEEAQQWLSHGLDARAIHRS